MVESLTNVISRIGTAQRRAPSDLPPVPHTVSVGAVTAGEIPFPVGNLLFTDDFKWVLTNTPGSLITYTASPSWTSRDQQRLDFVPIVRYFLSNLTKFIFRLRTFFSLTVGGSSLATFWCLTMRSRCGHGPPSWILRVLSILCPFFPISTHGRKLSTVCLANIDNPGSASPLLLLFSQLNF